MSVSDVQNVYWRPSLDQVARLLSWQDREPFSKTYGCFDRTFWCWKFSDFPGARFQEGVYALAYLYSTSAAHNPLYGDERVLTWVRAGMHYWQRIQYADGSFDEAYPYEHSLAATAFTGFYVGEAFLLVCDHLPASERDQLRGAFARAGTWLCNNDEYHGILSNHLAAAAAALHTIYRICGDARYDRRCDHFLQRIYDHQSPEGWYEEYGGADPGYQTHATFYMAHIWRHRRDATLLASLQRSLAFLKYCFHPDGTLGGEYGSRNTEFYFPAGFEMLATVLPDAALIARFMRPTVSKQTGVGLAAMDAYNLLPILNNYLFAIDHVRNLNRTPGVLPCEETGETYFADAGLYFKSTRDAYMILGLSKGGTVKIFDKAASVVQGSDCGYWATLPNGRTISSQSLRRPGRWQQSGKTFTIETDFVEVNQRIFSPWLFMGFRLFSLTMGQVQAAAYGLKNILVYVLVRRRRDVPLRLVRRVRLETAHVIIMDEITATEHVTLRTLQSSAKFATIHMGSSRYFQYQELDSASGEHPDYAADLMRQHLVSIERVIPPGTPAEAFESEDDI